MAKQLANTKEGFQMIAVRPATHKLLVQLKRRTGMVAYRLVHDALIAFGESTKSLRDGGIAVNSETEQNS